MTLGRLIGIIVTLCVGTFTLCNLKIFLAVNLKACLRSADRIQSSDPDFRVLDDGSVYTASATVLSEERSFIIRLSDIKTGIQKEIPVLLEQQQKVSNYHIYFQICLFLLKYSSPKLQQEQGINRALPPVP